MKTPITGPIISPKPAAVSAYARYKSLLSKNVFVIAESITVVIVISPAPCDNLAAMVPHKYIWGLLLLISAKKAVPRTPNNYIIYIL